MSLKYTRNKTVDIAAPPSRLLKLLQEDPVKFLEISGVTIQESLSGYKAGDDSGEWMVEEKLSIPFVPSTKFKTSFTRLDNGCQWESWAPLGVHVRNSLVVSSPKNSEDQEESSSCQAIEVATLSAPFFVYPLVRWQFNKSHNANLIKLKKYIESKTTTTTTT